jgi:hypothetical protein
VPSHPVFWQSAQIPVRLPRVLIMSAARGLKKMFRAVLCCSQISLRQLPEPQAFRQLREDHRFLLGFPVFPERFWGADADGSGAEVRMIFSRTQ